ncbi:MAG: hypothetical protein FJ128_04090 [Deltaproteobacteria bacterium]|nr:hypothetical protein [Deltaproteobacteria bacterium]
MRKLSLIIVILGVAGLLALLLAAPQAPAQWGYGVDAARKAMGQGKQESGKSGDGGPHNVAGEDVGGKGLASTTTFKNKVRPFSYTIPAGWRQEGGGDPTGERAQFMKPGTTAGFTFHFTQLVPSFPRQASVDASFKQAKEEMSIGKYISVKRRDQGQVIGWETIESPTKGSGGFQRIQWQCYDAQNYYYSFIAHSDPRQFEQHRAALQGIINSITFGR